MKRATIIKSDSAVYVDGHALPVDVSHLPEFIHAIQWYGDRDPPYGEIEFVPDSKGVKMPNIKFSDFKPYQFLVDKWTIEKKTIDDAAKKAEAKAALVKAKT